MATQEPAIGFIGLGAMGGPMVRNLVAAGYRIHAFDLNPERLAASVEGGASAAASAAEVVERGEWILTSLPSSDAFVEVAEQALLPRARPGQVFVDLGTTTPPETRRLAALFEAQGAALVDAPVSGGPGGAEQATLLMFAGGDPTFVERCRPLLQVLAGAGQITYCGPSGCGQVVKGVNQLMMGLGAAAYIEALSFGVNAGVDAATIAQAIGDSGRWRRDFNAVARQAVEGRGESVGVKFRELPYFLREAREQGFELPLTERLYAFCDAGPRVVVDDNRPAPSFWRELTADE